MASYSIQCPTYFTGSQNGIAFFDWKGEDAVLNYDFVENGIGIDERCVEGGMVKGWKLKNEKILSNVL